MRKLTSTNQRKGWMA